MVDLLREVARKATDDEGFRETLSKSNLGWAYADAAEFRATMLRDNTAFRQLIPKLQLKT